MSAKAKYRKLLELLRATGGAVVAFSGGVDSTLLLAAAREALGDRALAVSGLSPSFPGREYTEAVRLAKQIGTELRTVETDELDDPSYNRNPHDRCFHCKTHLFTILRKVADEEGLSAVLDGSNADDTGDYRPGIDAARSLGVLSPLMDAGLTKDEIRSLLKERDLDVWDKPAQACLASRIPYGQEITEERLNRIARAEGTMLDMGYRTVRVRDWGHLGVVEVGPDELDRLFESGERISVSAALKEVGYKRVAFDTSGYVTGSLNLALFDD